MGNMSVTIVAWAVSLLVELSDSSPVKAGVTHNYRSTHEHQR